MTSYAAVRRAQPVPTFLPLEWAIVGTMVLVVVALGMISPSLLTYFKLHYVTTGGAFYEKLHPATYLTVAAFGLLLLRHGDPVGQVDRIVSSARLLLVFLFCWGLLVLQCIILRRPFTGVIDTFLLPVLFSVLVWSLSAAQKRPLAWTLHLVLWINIAVGYYEYFSGHHVVPLTVGDLPVYGEWRSTAFLGNPLSASSCVALYVMALILRPGLIPVAALRGPAIALSLASLMMFGGRTALVSVLVVIFCLVAAQGFRVLRGARVPLPAVILAIGALFLIAAGLVAIFQSGTFDNMLTRFSSDKGSAHARLASLHLLTLLDWKEFAFGTEPVHGSALQSMMGLQYGIESFWIACIVQYGVVSTALITLGMACFFAELLRRSDWTARVALLFIFIDASSSVSFSSKNITLAALIALIVILLPRAPLPAAPPLPPRNPAFRPSAIPVR